MVSFIHVFRIICVLAFLLVGSQGKFLVWKHNTNYNSSENWSSGSKPCSTDTVVFPADVRLTVEIPKGRHAMKELVLPSEGELVMPSGASIVITSKDFIDGSCDGGVNLWRQKSSGLWLDPDNWQGAYPAAPDLERIPCPTDQVAFKPGSTFRVELPPFSISVSSVTINKQLLSGEEWEDYSISSEGDRQFFGGPLEATGELCNDPSGCECPSAWLSRWICPRRQCPEPNCLAPIKVLGDCCMSCGASLLYRFVSTTNLANVRTRVKSILGSDVSWYVGRTMGYIQVVIRHDDNVDHAESIAKDLNTKLLSDHSLHLIGKTLSSSGPSYSEGGIRSPVSIFFLTFILAVAAFGAILYYFERGSADLPSFLGGGRAFVTARFENTSGRLVMGGKPSQRIPSTSVGDDTPRGFDNPMYSQDLEQFGSQGSTLPDTEKGQDTGSVSDDSSSTTSFDRKTVTTLAIADDPAMEDVPIGQLLG